jgi:KaiC/GvpD/RAD55 family RecA-like ATPase
MTCDIEWFSNQHLHWKINILQNQHGILSDQLFRVDHVNQLNELRIQILNHEREEYVEFVESSKQVAVDLQRQLDIQQATFEVKRRKHALTIQSLQHESIRCEATERCLEHERAIVQTLTDILNKLELSNEEDLSIDLSNNINLDTLFHEWKSTKSEVKSLRNKLQRTINELQHKQLVLDNLSKKFKIQSQSMSETSFSDSDEKINTETVKLQSVLTTQEKRRRLEWEEEQMLFAMSLLRSRKTFVWF